MHKFPVPLLALVLAAVFAAACSHSDSTKEISANLPAEAEEELAEKVFVGNLVEYANHDSPEALANARGCMACHQVDEKKIGPSFRSVAAQYQNQQDALPKLSRKVLEGGGGTWGLAAMPANKALGVTEVDATRLVSWVLSLK
jgi:cytochrome c